MRPPFQSFFFRLPFSSTNAICLLTFRVTSGPLITTARAYNALATPASRLIRKGSGLVWSLLRDVDARGTTRIGEGTGLVFNVSPSWETTHQQRTTRIGPDRTDDLPLPEDVHRRLFSFHYPLLFRLVFLPCDRCPLTWAPITRPACLESAIIP